MLKGVGVSLKSDFCLNLHEKSRRGGDQQKVTKDDKTWEGVMMTVFDSFKIN